MKNNIRKLRRPLGLSQHRLGKKVGVSRTTINLIENGKTMPSLRLANEISKALEHCICEVFDLENEYCTCSKEEE